MFPALGSLFPFIPCLGEYECLSPGLLRFPGGKKVIASSLNEDVLGPQEEHLSLSIGSPLDLRIDRREDAYLLLCLWIRDDGI